MDKSANTSTPISMFNILTPQSSNKSKLTSVTSSEKISKSLLTPCRRIGLKRKSLSDTKKHLLEAHSLNQLVCSKSNDDVNCSSKLRFLNCTPVKTLLSKEHAAGETSDSAVNACSYIKPVDKEQELLSDELENIPDINLEMLESLAKNVRQKKDRFKRIELSKLYEKKHGLQMLKELTEKWKTGCQNALLELQRLIQESGHSITMAILLDQFQISHDSIGYNEESDDFE